MNPPTVLHCEKHDALYPSNQGCSDCRAERFSDRLNIAVMLLSGLVLLVFLVKSAAHYLEHP